MMHRENLRMRDPWKSLMTILSRERGFSFLTVKSGVILDKLGISLFPYFVSQRRKVKKISRHYFCEQQIYCIYLRALVSLRKQKTDQLVA